MQQRTSNLFTYLLLAAVAFCFVALAFQAAQIRELQSQVSDSSAALQQTADDAAALQDLLERQQGRIDALEGTQGLSSAKPGVPTPEQLESLKPGIYILETSTPYDPGAEDTPSYEITHVVVEISYEDFATRLHIGMAKSGWIPKGVYFDYNNDGRVDTDMAFEFVRDIPVIGRRLAKTYGVDLSQSLYSIFVDEAANADYTSVDDLSDDADAASSYVWTFLMQYYDTIEAWVLEKLQEDRSEADQTSSTVTT
ncbi:MAG: hypothetical protein WBN07_05850, partial [Woeseiaceae bacterium]